MNPLATLGIYAVVVGAVVAATAAVRRRFDRVSLTLFVALPILFLAPGFFSTRTPIPLDHVPRFPPWSAPAAQAPHNPSLSDVATQFAPWAKAVRIAWKEGSLPFRSRWDGCGAQLAFSGQSAAFSPLTLLLFALPLSQAFVALGAAKLLLAQAGTYLWLSELGLSPQAARFGAVTFGFSFALTPWLLHPATAGISLWPWILFSVELLSDSAVSWRGFVFLVAILAAWPLGGHLETVALGALFCGLWFAGRALTGDLSQARRILPRAALAALLALGLSAFALVPQLRVIQASNRLVLAQSPARYEYVPWVPYRPGWLGGFVTSIYPRAFGDMIDSPMIPGAAGSIVEMGFGYFGVVGWCCAAMIMAGDSRRRTREVILGALVITGLGGAMGLPPFRWFFDALPGLGLLSPLRLLLFVSAAGAPLAALAVDRALADPRPRWRFLIAVEVAVAATAIAVYFVLRQRYTNVGSLVSQRKALVLTLVLLAAAAAGTYLVSRNLIGGGRFVTLLTALSVLELILQGSRLYRFYPPKSLYPETPLVRFLRAQPPPYRIVGAGGALFPSTNIFANVESIETSDPAERADYIAFLDRTAGYPPFDYFRSVRDFNSAGLDFLNVLFLVTPVGMQSPGPKWTLVYSGDDGRVFQNANVLPRFFAPGRIRAIRPRGRATINAMKAFGRPLDDFLIAPTFREEALVLREAGFGAVSENPGGVLVTALSETTNRVRILTSVPPNTGPAIVVSSLVTDGGWSAKDEKGSALPVGLANGPFLALSVPPGEHRVTLFYSPPGFRLGVVVSVATLFGLVLSAIVIPGRLRRHLFAV